MKKKTRARRVPRPDLKIQQNILCFLGALFLAGAVVALGCLTDTQEEVEHQNEAVQGAEIRIEEWSQPSAAERRDPRGHALSTARMYRMFAEVRGDSPEAAKDLERERRALEAHRSYPDRQLQKAREDRAEGSVALDEARRGVTKWWFYMGLFALGGAISIYLGFLLDRKPLQSCIAGLVLWVGCLIVPVAWYEPSLLLTEPGFYSIFAALCLATGIPIAWRYELRKKAAARAAA